MAKHELFGIDGGHIGTISVHPQGSGKEMGIAQVNITVCAWKNFDQWWHEIYSRVRDMYEELEKPTTQGEV